MSKLPEQFRVFFWDTDFDKLDLTENRAFIISRLYTKGGFPGIFWVEKTYSAQDIAYAAKTRRDLNPIVANFLRTKCNLKKEDMNYYRIGQAALWR